MSFIVGLLFFGLFILLTVLLFVIVVVMRGINSVRRFLHLGGGNKYGQASSNGQTTYRQTHTADGITITDHRSPEEANKKIFAPDEGEYVEYTEQ